MSMFLYLYSHLIEWKFFTEHSDEGSIRDQNQRNRDQRYSIRGQSQQTLSCDSVTFKTDSTGNL